MSAVRLPSVWAGKMSFASPSGAGEAYSDSRTMYLVNPAWKPQYFSTPKLSSTILLTAPSTAAAASAKMETASLGRRGGRASTLASDLHDVEDGAESFGGYQKAGFPSGHIRSVKPSAAAGSRASSTARLSYGRPGTFPT